MSESDAFIRAICAEPEDDNARLVYADWLEEHGEPDRAEFIRVQCELAKLQPETRDDPACWCDQIAPSLPCCDVCQGHEDKVEELRQREQELFNAHGQDWILPLARALGISEAPGHHKGNRFRYIGSLSLSFGENGPDLGVGWSRGFVESITCSAATWLAHADELYWHPKQTVHCELCLGRGDIWAGSPSWSPAMKTVGSYARCSACDRTGRISRPFPGGTHPIRKVKLTTQPDLTMVAGGMQWVTAAGVACLVSLLWPGITFHLTAS